MGLILSHFLLFVVFSFAISCNSYSVLAKKEFEKQFENELKQYDDATIKEVIELYG